MLAVVKANIARRIRRDACIVYTRLLQTGGRVDHQLKKPGCRPDFIEIVITVVGNLGKPSSDKAQTYIL